MSLGTGVLVKPLMFLSSYAPLFLLLAIRLDSLPLQLVCVVLGALGFLGLFLLMRFQHQAPAQQGRFELTEVSRAGDGASSYLAGYLLPFVTLASPTGRDIIAYTGFFLVAYVVTTRTGIIQVNPTLFVAGYGILSVTDTNGSQRYLLCKTREVIASGSIVMASRLTDDVLLFERMAPIPTS